MTHLTWEQLNDYADGSMAPSARAGASSHLDSCAECRDTVARLRSLLDAAKSAPASIEPPIEAWHGIRNAIEVTKVVPLSGASRAAPYSRSALIAAAVVLVIASSAVTLLVTGHDLGVRVPPGTLLAPNGTIPIATQTGRGTRGALPASFIEEERGYLATVSELTATLDKSRDKLAPETVRTVEHSLKVIDDAIAEARAALERDPSNPLLRDFLTKHYEQKVDFLRRVSGRTS
jgi:hypothetical protein